MTAVMASVAMSQVGPVAVAYTELATPIGLVGLFATELGLLTVALPNETPTAARERVLRVYGAVNRVAATPVLAAARAQLEAYFGGELREFDLSLDVRGTTFQRAVWASVAAVGFGETRSYGDIARAIGRPQAVRAVGLANGANPLPIVIPCHRIIGANGALTGYGGGLATKRALLAFERGQAVLF